jgi:NADH-quinone oxidoreductase subunit G
MDASGILSALRDGKLKALVMLGSDPVGDFADRDLAREALTTADFVVSFDLFLNESAAMADVVLPVEGMAEAEGTATNLEGRVQKVNRIRPGPGQSRPAWSALDDLARRMGGELGATSAATIAKEIEATAPAYRGVTWDALDWGEGRDGIVVPTGEGEQPLQYVPADPGLRSGTGGMGLHLARVLYDRGVTVRMSPSLAALVPDAAAHLHPRDAGALAVGPGDVVAISGDGPRVELPVVVDPSLAPGSVYVPANLDATAGFWSTTGVSVEPVRASADAEGQA